MSENPCQELFEEMFAAGEAWESILQQKSALRSQFKVVTPEFLDIYKKLDEREQPAWDFYIQKMEEHANCKKQYSR